MGMNRAKKRYILELFFFLKSRKVKFCTLELCSVDVGFWLWIEKQEIDRNLKYKSITETGHESQSHDFTNVKKWKIKKQTDFLNFNRPESEIYCKNCLPNTKENFI